jgi:competence protein ComEC
MNKRPIVWAAIVWIAGAAAALEWKLQLISLQISIVLAALAVCAVLLRLPGRQWIVITLILGISMGYNSWYDGRNVTLLELDEDRLEGIVRGTISSAVELDGDRVSFILLAREASLGEKRQDLAAERLQVFVRLDSEQDQEAARTWRRGDAVELAGELQLPMSARNFGGFDYRRYLYRQHIHWLLNVKGAGNVSNVSQPAEFGIVAARWLDDWRTELGGRMERWYGEQGGFMKSLVLGIREDLDPDQFRQFSELGLTHILAISGLHVAVVLGGLAAVLRLARITRETNLLICMMAVPPYVLLTGASPSAIRAGLMALLALFALRIRIAKEALHLAAMAALVMLAWEPYYLYDVGFQLSFLVTVGLIIGVPMFQSLIRLKPKWLSDTIAVTTVAQAVSFPITIYYFNQFSLLSWSANLILVPLLSLIVLPLGMISLLLGFLWEPLGGWIGKPAAWVNELSFRIVEEVSSWSWGATSWAAPEWWWLCSYYALLIALYKSALYVKEHGKHTLFFLACGIFTCLVFYGYHPDLLHRHGVVQFIDVGQGDAILIRTPEKRTILIDGGGTVSFAKAEEGWRIRKEPYEVGRKLLVPLLKKRGVHQIDWLIVSHLDTDHIGGLRAVLEDIPVRAMISNGSLRQGEVAEELMNSLLEKQIPIFPAEAGESIRIDSETELEFLFPHLGMVEAPAFQEDQNERSVVALMTMYGRSFLFTGDISSREENQIVQARLQASPTKEGSSTAAVNNIDVLKVAHHGSKTSTSELWLDYWRPQLAVVSSGVRNIYGHPHPTVVDRIGKSGAELYRTDLQGEIQIRVSSDGISVVQKLP